MNMNCDCFFEVGAEAEDEVVGFILLRFYRSYLAGMTEYVLSTYAMGEALGFATPQ